jgi:hypothetical protein
MHGTEVEIEMADITTVETDIGLPADYDVIDQACGPCIIGREPPHSDACNVLLKALEQGHEIPDSKNVIFHEAPEIGDGSDVRVNGMVQQHRTKAAQVVAVVFRHCAKLRVRGVTLGLPSDGCAARVCNSHREMRAERALLNRCEFDLAMRDFHE